MYLEKKLIVTVAVNYSKNNLDVFIKSILKNCPNCDILFFCDRKVSNDVKRFYPEDPQRKNCHRTGLSASSNSLGSNGISDAVILKSYLCLFSRKTFPLPINRFFIG